MVSVSLPLPQLLSLAFLVMLFGSTVYSVVLIYHWRAYGESGTVVTHTILLYLCGVVCFFIGMGAAVSMAF
jgi:hypothetical protein